MFANASGFALNILKLKILYLEFKKIPAVEIPQSAASLPAEARGDDVLATAVRNKDIRMK
jgi:hypothetical protein